MSIAQFPVDKMLKTPDQHQKPEMYIVLAAAFCRECGFRYLPFMPEAFRKWLLEGFEAALLFYAIDKTARAPRPSYAYLDYLVNTWRREKLFTKKAVLDDLERRKKYAETYSKMINGSCYPGQLSTDEMVAKMHAITEDEILQAADDARREAAT